jgi:hypothetical protein
MVGQHSTRKGGAKETCACVSAPRMGSKCKRWSRTRSHKVMKGGAGAGGGGGGGLFATVEFSDMRSLEPLHPLTDILKEDAASARAVSAARVCCKLATSLSFAAAVDTICNAFPYQRTQASAHKHPDTNIRTQASAHQNPHTNIHQGTPPPTQG